MRGLVKLMSVALVATLVPSIASGATVLFSHNLNDMDGWSVVNGGDSMMTFAYDYSADGIPEAPNTIGGAALGGDATTGAKAESNRTLGSADAIAAVQNLASLGHVAGSNYRVQVDVWGNFELGSGSATEFAGISVGRDPGSSSTDGATFLYTVDGGSSRDYRMYKDFDEQRTSGTDPVEGAQYNTASNNGLANPYANAFPVLEPEVVTGGQQGAPPGVFTDAGDGGFRWVTLEAIIHPLEAGPAGTTADLGTARFTIKNNDNGFNIHVGTLDNSNGDSTLTTFEDRVGFIYADLFSSLNTSGFNFGIFDNFIVTEVPEPASMVLFGLGVCGMLGMRRRIG